MTTDPNTLKSTTTQQKENDVGLHNVGYLKPSISGPFESLFENNNPPRIYFTYHILFNGRNIFFFLYVHVAK